MAQSLRVAMIGSYYARARYRNRRQAARSFNPQPATGGFPYNLRSVAELDPWPKPKGKVCAGGNETVRKSMYCKNSRCPCQYGLEGVHGL